MATGGGLQAALANSFNLSDEALKTYKDDVIAAAGASFDKHKCVVLRMGSYMQRGLLCGSAIDDQMHIANVIRGELRSWVAQLVGVQEEHLAEHAGIHVEASTMSRRGVPCQPEISFAVSVTDPRKLAQLLRNEITIDGVVAYWSGKEAGRDRGLTFWTTGEDGKTVKRPAAAVVHDFNVKYSNAEKDEAAADYYSRFMAVTGDYYGAMGDALCLCLLGLYAKELHCNMVLGGADVPGDWPIQGVVRFEPGNTHGTVLDHLFVSEQNRNRPVTYTNSQGEAKNFDPVEQFGLSFEGWETVKMLWTGRVGKPEFELVELLFEKRAALAPLRPPRNSSGLY